VFRPEEAVMADFVVPTQYRLRVERRMAIVAYTREHGIKPASRHFGLARRTIRTWLRRWQADGPLGLVPHYPQHRKPRSKAAPVTFSHSPEGDVQYAGLED
jgi:transposase